jgi:hypothetical protein
MLLHFAESKLNVISSAGVVLDDIVEDIVVVVDLSSAREVDGTELPRWPTISGCLDARCETS